METERKRKDKERCIKDGMGGSREQTAEELVWQKKTDMKINIF
jgi:hypothetical protein